MGNELMKVAVRACVIAGSLLAGVSLAAEFTGLQNANLQNPGNLMQGNIELWSKKRIGTPHALRFEDDVQGVSAARFEIRPDDKKISDGYRAELRDPYVASPHEEVWYRFNTLIPGRLLEDQELSIVLAQWHDKKTEGRPATRPPLALRIQRERIGNLDGIPGIDEYFANYGVSEERLKLAKPDAIVMHPGPMNRGIEIEGTVADGPQSVITQQVTNGVAVRMAVLEHVAGVAG